MSDIEDAFSQIFGSEEMDVPTYTPRQIKEGMEISRDVVMSVRAFAEGVYSILAMNYVLSGVNWQEVKTGLVDDVQSLEKGILEAMSDHIPVYDNAAHAMIMKLLRHAMTEYGTDLISSTNSG